MSHKVLSKPSFTLPLPTHGCMNSSCNRTLGLPLIPSQRLCRPPILVLHPSWDVSAMPSPRRKASQNMAPSRDGQACSQLSGHDLRLETRPTLSSWEIYSAVFRRIISLFISFVSFTCSSDWGEGSPFCRLWTPWCFPLPVPCSLAPQSYMKELILDSKTHLFSPVAITILSPTSNQTGPPGCKTGLCWTFNSKRDFPREWHVHQMGKIGQFLAFTVCIYFKISLLSFSKCISLGTCIKFSWSTH